MVAAAGSTAARRGRALGVLWLALLAAGSFPRMLQLTEWAPQPGATSALQAPAPQPTGPPTVPRHLQQQLRAYCERAPALPGGGATAGAQLAGGSTAARTVAAAVDVQRSRAVDAPAPAAGNATDAADVTSSAAAAAAPQVPAPWPALAGLLGGGAARHGRQAKAGMPAQWRHLMEHMVNMRAEGPTGMPPAVTPNVTAWYRQIRG